MTLHRTPFWYLRHGETDWNARGWSQGNVDIPLNARGIAQAHAAAAMLRGTGIATIVASPLGRARVTAEIAGAALGLPVAIEEGLRECSFGVLEGKPMTEWFDHWVEGRATPEGAEPFADLRVRAVAAVNRHLGAPAPVLLVAHGAVFRALRAAMGMEPNVRTPNATPVLVSPRGDGWTLSWPENAAAIGDQPSPLPR